MITQLSYLRNNMNTSRLGPEPFLKHGFHFDLDYTPLRFRDLWFQCFPFIIFMNSCAMHSGSVTVPAPHLHKVLGHLVRHTTPLETPGCQRM